MTKRDALGKIVLSAGLVCGTATLMAGPPQGGEWQPIPELTDEFEGEKLDSEKWRDHNPDWLGRQPGFFSTNTHWHQPLHMNIDSETFPDWFGLPEKETLPSTFSIEYVRSWRRAEDAEPDTKSAGQEPTA